MTESLGKFDRLIRILRYLSSPGGATVRQLGSLTGADVRSIQRDLQFLNEKCFDIVQDKHRGPYRLNRELDIYGQTLSLEEVLCLSLGTCVVEAQFGELGHQAMQKLQHFIKGDKKLAARDFPNSLAFGNHGERQTWMPELLRSLSEHKTVKFGYRGEPPSRTVNPFTLFFQSERWYLQGLDHDRNELRRFRVSRMKNLEVQHEAFQIPPCYESHSALFHKWDLCPGSPVLSHFEVTASMAEWLAENPVHPSQKLEDGVLELQVRDLDALASWILGLNGIRVISPMELRTRIKEKALAVVALHG